MYWRIWIELYENDKKLGSGIWHQYYKYKANAIRAANKRFGQDRVNQHTGKIYTYKWIVSQTNPYHTQ